jgi:hypothetical protein
MGLSKEEFKKRDVYIDYGVEQVMFRFKHSSRQYFQKSYGEHVEEKIKNDSGLLNEAVRFGVEIDEHTYKTGKPSI